MKSKTKKGFKLLLLFMTSLMLFSIGSPIVQHVHAEDPPSSSVNKDDKDKDKDKDKDDDKKKDEDTDSSSSSNYKNLMVPSILSTAYANGLKAASASASDASTSDEKAYEKFYANVNNILAYQNDHGQHVFSNVGTFFGQVGLSSGSSTNDIASLSSVTKDELDSRFSVGDDKLGLAYLNFGNAYTKLVSHAEKRDTSSVGVESVVTGFTSTSKKVANIGVSLLNMFSPAPVIMAFHDSGVLTDGKYDDNKLIKIIRDTDMLGNIVRFFGDPAPGFPMISTADMIVVSIIMFTIGLSLLSIFINGRHFGTTVRKIMLKIVVVAVALPLSARLFDFGVGLLTDTTSEQANNADTQVVSSNLLLGPWANVTKFGLPEGTILNVRDGEFTLSSTDIYNINMYVAKKAGVISNETGAKADKKVAKYIKSAVSADKNKTTIGWTNLIRSHTNTPWKTDRLLQLADTLGGNKDVNPDVKIKDIGYLTEGGLISTPDGSQFSQSGPSIYGGFGMTPIAAFNIINTTFDNNKLSVKSNLVNNLTIPTVAVGANTYLYSDSNSDSNSDGQQKREMNPLVKMVLDLVMLFAAIKALAKIFSAGFGGVLHGGGASVFGSTAGFGELVGGVIALIGGVLGISIIITIVDGVLDAVWNQLMTAIGIGKDNLELDDVLPADLLDTIGGFKFIGKYLVETMASVMNFILSILALFLLPKLIKVPIEAFGSWMSGYPAYLSEKAQAMENKFTGDYHAGGLSRGNHIKNAWANSAAQMKEQGKVIKTGAAMLAGAALKSGASSLSGAMSHMLSNKSLSSVTGDTNISNEDKNEDGLTPINEPITGDSESQELIGDSESQASIGTSESQAPVGTSESQTPIGDSESQTPIGDSESQAPIGDSESQAPIGDSESQAPIGDNFEPIGAMETSESPIGDSESQAPIGDNFEPIGAMETSESQSPIGTSESKEPIGTSESKEPIGTSESQAPMGDNFESITKATGETAAAGVSEFTNENSIIDASQEGDSLQSEDSSQSVQASNKQDSVTQEGNNSDTSTNIDGGQVVNSSDSVASSADAKVDASQLSSEQSVTSQGGTDNSSKTESKTASNNSQSSKSIKDGDKTTNNASITRTNSGLRSKTKRAQVSSRAARLVERVKNNSVLQNVTGTAKGEVTAKEQAAMGAAHMVAGVMGAHGITQQGVDHLNRRKAQTPHKETPNVVQSRPTGMNPNNEMLIRQQEQYDQEYRDRKQSDRQLREPLRETTTKKKVESTKTRKFFETVSDKK